jgi:hypothetical protein
MDAAPRALKKDVEAVDTPSLMTGRLQEFP